VIPIEEPYGSLAVKIAENYVRCKLEEEKYAKDKLNQVKEDVVCKALREESHRVAIHAVRRKALEALWRYQVLKGSSGQTFRPVCLYQPHACKKDIMFTSLIFGLALGRLNDIDYLWTSDSDTWVYTDTLYQTIGCMAADPLIGGSCTALSIHNEKDSLISMLGSAAYWSELAITRGQTGAVDAVDCQPGPCAAFRLDALEPILMSWYTQTSLGVKTVRRTSLCRETS
jgi:hyaluronan synthase